MREMNTANMVPNLNPNIGVRLGTLLFNLASGHNHLDMYVLNLYTGGYDGGLWTEREVGGVRLPVLPKGNYKVVNPANYSSYEVDAETAGAALWLIALSYLSFGRWPEKDRDALAEAYHAAREVIFKDKTLDTNAIAAITD